MDQPDFNQFKTYRKKRYLGVLFFVLAASGLIYGMSKYGIGANEINVTNEDSGNTIWNKVTNLFAGPNGEGGMTIDDDPDYVMPKSDDGRWDILILGIRGEEENHPEEVGAWLTDTMMVLSHDNKTGKTSLISIPRDLYVRIYGTKMGKINEAYETGVLRKNSLGFTRKLISKITGVYIDNAIVVNFASFEKIIDELGGIDIELSQPFTEKTQWGYEFSLPAGKNHLDSQTALYYVRSRFSSSDFDRAQRQQKVMVAIKDKVMALSLLSDPIKTLGILHTIQSNIETDLKIWDINGLVSLSKEFSGAGDKIRRLTITTENLLYETHIGNIYVLLPKGDNLQGIKQFFQDALK
ncbi:MAG: LCP family protein [Candidatus Yanofskybacteria bacterium]|nr:LCP family protein [Candidatus Yanofskybacteria bacterium]